MAAKWSFTKAIPCSLENSIFVDSFAQTQLRGIVTSSDAKSGSGTKGKVEKIEKISNILKERYYYMNALMLKYIKTLGGEPYSYKLMFVIYARAIKRARH